MKAKEINKKTDKELKKMLVDKKKELEKAVTDIYKGKEKNVSKLKFIRKDIARVNTILRKKQDA